MGWAGLGCASSARIQPESRCTIEWLALAAVPCWAVSCLPGTNSITDASATHSWALEVYEVPAPAPQRRSRLRYPAKA